MEQPVALAFPAGLRATAVRVERDEEIPDALRALGLDAPRPVLVVVGGAAGLAEDVPIELRTCVTQLVRLAASLGSTIVDGGTDAGVMRLVGLARVESDAALRLVGVVVRALAGLPGDEIEPPAEALEPHHTDFVLVPGSGWGDEAPWLAQVASALAGDSPSVTVLVNGGDIAWKDVAESIDAGRRVLVVAGTGRTADALAAAAAGLPGDARAELLARSSLVEAVGLGEDTDRSLLGRVRDILSTGRTADGG